MCLKDNGWERGIHGKVYMCFCLCVCACSFVKVCLGTYFHSLEDRMMGKVGQMVIREDMTMVNENHFVVVN